MNETIKLPRWWGRLDAVAGTKLLEQLGYKSVSMTRTSGAGATVVSAAEVQVPDGWTAMRLRDREIDLGDVSYTLKRWSVYDSEKRLRLQVIHGGPNEGVALPDDRDQRAYKALVATE